MRGTELTEAQIQSAREFVSGRQVAKSDNVIDDATTISLRFGDLARLVAWYGAIRYQAGASGIGGSLETPGPMDVTSNREETLRHACSDDCRLEFDARFWEQKADDRRGA